ncbi:hypothetical protein C7821_102427 [Streptomyces sp. VMFN-G11Ma]|jgi:hypothetical protein|nr:hypothetical protein C7821_102427 [Streptomyces sp. VMFN-G11Ma]
MPPFTSCGRIWEWWGVCDLGLKGQVSPLFGVGMASEMYY